MTLPQNLSAPSEVESPQQSDREIDSAQEVPSKAGAFWIIRKVWIWMTGFAIAAAVILRLGKLAYPDPFACPQPEMPAREGVIYLCSFGGPIIRYDQLMFGVIYVWVFVSLLIVLVGMRWRAAGMVLVMALVLAAADFTSQVIYDYFR